MDLKKFSKAKKIYEEITLIDKEVVELEKLAMLCANGEVKISLTLGVEDIGKKNQEGCKVRFDEDGSIIKDSDSNSNQHGWYIRFSGIMDGCSSQKNEVKYVSTLKKEITENATLEILAVLLREKLEKRKGLLKQINKLGIDI